MILMVYMAIKFNVFYTLTPYRLLDIYEGFLKIFFYQTTHHHVTDDCKP
jgi:hypothetical protein